MISAEFPYQKKTASVFGSQMAYVDVGSGDPIVFLHGNPTSSYLWRNVIPYLEGLGRCIAPDLIGMGDSEKLSESGPGSYTFAEHRRYLDALLETLNVNSNIILVLHDWGSALGFDWANRHRTALKGIVYMEAIVLPRHWDDWPDPVQQIFKKLRSAAGEAMVLEQNLFVEALLPGSLSRTLSDEEMAEYRRPFAESGEGRRPTLTWPRQIPVEGDPTDVTEIVNSYAEWLTYCPVPKLFVNGNPGRLLTGRHRDFCRTWPTQTEVTVKGLHFLQEDSPDEIGQAVAAWMQELEQVQRFNELNDSH
jgi:haloalkane dehalogenase